MEEIKVMHPSNTDTHHAYLILNVFILLSTHDTNNDASIFLSHNSSAIYCNGASDIQTLTNTFAYIHTVVQDSTMSCRR
jgi:hypothetical protein